MLCAAKSDYSSAQRKAFLTKKIRKSARFRLFQRPAKLMTLHEDTSKCDLDDPATVRAHLSCCLALACGDCDGFMDQLPVAPRGVSESAPGRFRSPALDGRVALQRSWPVRGAAHARPTEVTIPMVRDALADCHRQRFGLSVPLARPSGSDARG
jgi:hypothetical protein